MALTFGKIYNATTEFFNKLKEPLVEEKNMRAIDSAICSAKEQQLKAEEDLENCLMVVKEGKTIDINELLQYKQIIIDCSNTIEILQEFKKEFFKKETKKSKED